MNQTLNLSIMQKIDWKSIGKKVLKVTLMVALVVAFVNLAQTNYICDDIWTKSRTTAQDIYTNVKELATYVAGTLFIIALGISFFSKDQRKVDSALDWAKRIFIVYLIILGAGYIFSYGRELFSSAPNIFGSL